MKINRIYIVVAMFTLLVLSQQVFGTRAVLRDLPPLCGSTPCIQVGTFNIEWLGTTDPSKHEPRSELVIQQIADLIATTLDLEIVVLEEINSASDEYEQFEAALAEHGYKLRSGTTGGQQRVVIAYDDDEVDLVSDGSAEGVTELDVRASFNLSGNCTSSGLRRPLMGRFRAGQFDFILIGVHLKAQPGGNCSDRVRREQCKDLIAKVNEIVDSSTEKDVIITGDFNATFEDSSLNPLLQSTGFRVLTRPSRRANGSNDISYLEAPFQEIIDHLLVRLSDTGEWITKTTFIFNPPSDPTLLANYLRFISDHAPVWASFKTDADDD